MSFSIAKLSRLDRGERAQLRQVLQHELTHPPIAAMRHVEGESNAEGQAPGAVELQMHYLVAGLYALRYPDPLDSPVSGPHFAVAAAELTLAKADFDANKPSPLERRFLALLDGSRNELAYPLRQWITLFKQSGTDLDWTYLLRDLVFWGDGVKDKWGREYYRTLKRADTDEESDATSEEENL